MIREEPPHIAGCAAARRVCGVLQVGGRTGGGVRFYCSGSLSPGARRLTGPLPRTDISHRAGGKGDWERSSPAPQDVGMRESRSSLALRLLWRRAAGHTANGNDGRECSSPAPQTVGMRESRNPLALRLPWRLVAGRVARCYVVANGHHEPRIRQRWLGTLLPRPAGCRNAGDPQPSRASIALEACRRARGALGRCRARPYCAAQTAKGQGTCVPCPL